MNISSSPTLTSVPPYSGNKTLSPIFTLTGKTLPSGERAPGPTATTYIIYFKINE